MYTVQAGCCRLPWMNVTCFEDFGELSDVFGSFGAAAKQVLWEPSLHFPVDEPEAHDSS